MTRILRPSPSGPNIRPFTRERSLRRQPCRPASYPLLTKKIGLMLVDYEKDQDRIYERGPFYASTPRRAGQRLFGKIKGSAPPRGSRGLAQVPEKLLDFSMRIERSKADPRSQPTCCNGAVARHSRWSSAETARSNSDFEPRDIAAAIARRVRAAPWPAKPDTAYRAPPPRHCRRSCARHGYDRGMHARVVGAGRESAIPEKAARRRRQIAR